MTKSFYKSYTEKGPIEDDYQGLTQYPAVYQILGKKNLPPIPQIAQKLIAACSAGEVNMQEVNDLVKWDPALCFEIMDMVHSGAYQEAKPARTVEQAVDLIGSDIMKDLVGYLSINTVFDTRMDNGPFDQMIFWRHSLKCALLAQSMSKEMHYGYSEEAFLAGLLHDIGKLILLKKFPDKYRKLLYNNPMAADLILKEDQTLGIDHCKTAAWLIEQWADHSFMADAILYHHHPLERVVNASPLVKILYIANILASTEEKENETVFQAAKKLFEPKEYPLDKCLADAEIRLQEICHFLGLDESQPEYSKGYTRFGNVGDGVFFEEARDTALVASVFPTIYQAESRSELLKAIRQCLQIMLGVTDIMFFLYNSDEKALIGHRIEAGDPSAMFETLSIPVRLEKSVVVSSLIKREPTDSFTHLKYSEPTILDLQIIHFLGREGILCLPLLEKRKFMGVIVMGIDRVELPFLSEHARLLDIFTRQASAVLNADRSKRDRLNQHHYERLESFILRTRKIVHEIKNPLSIIKNYLKVLGMRLSEQDIAHDEIRIVNEEINRIGNMLKTLSGFTTEDPSKKESIDINSLLSDLIKLMNESLVKQSGIKIHLDAESSIPDVMTHKDSLKQIFVNLIKNASEAMPEGGNIFIKTSYVAEKLEADESYRDIKPPGWVEISVADDGPGIPNGDKIDIFDPFVTSRNGHDGLGLSIVSDLVNRLNGTIRYESHTGMGASFKITFPLTSG